MTVALGGRWGFHANFFFISSPSVSDIVQSDALWATYGLQGSEEVIFGQENVTTGASNDFINHFHCASHDCLGFDGTFDPLAR
jgi:hypothetical protein